MRSFRQSLSASAIVALTLAATGCSSSEERRESNPYPPLPCPMADFCRKPVDGIYSISTDGIYYDILISNAGAVTLDNLVDGKLRDAKQGRCRFMDRIPDAGFIASLPLGQTESTMVKSLGEPTRIAYDLIPGLDSAVAWTPQVFGRDTRFDQYELVSFLPTKEPVTTSIRICYEKNSEGDWIAKGAYWNQSGRKLPPPKHSIAGQPPDSHPSAPSPSVAP